MIAPVCVDALEINNESKEENGGDPWCFHECSWQAFRIPVSCRVANPDFSPIEHLAEVSSTNSVIHHSDGIKNVFSSFRLTTESLIPAMNKPSRHNISLTNSSITHQLGTQDTPTPWFVFHHSLTSHRGANPPSTANRYRLKSRQYRPEQPRSRITLRHRQPRPPGRSAG